MEAENNTEKIKVEKIDTAVNSEIFKIYCNHFKSNIVSRAWRTGLNRINKHRLLGKLSRLLKPNRLALSGYYESYEKALEMSTGYNDDAIIEKVIVAINSVLRGKKKYERDGSCFNSAPKTNKIRLILQEIIDQSTCIVDFGGG